MAVTATMYGGAYILCLPLYYIFTLLSPIYIKLFLLLSFMSKWSGTLQTTEMIFEHEH